MLFHTLTEEDESIFLSLGVGNLENHGFGKLLLNGLGMANKRFRVLSKAIAILLRVCATSAENIVRVVRTRVYRDDRCPNFLQRLQTKYRSAHRYQCF